jgi:hypothetical protein
MLPVWTKRTPAVARAGSDIAADHHSRLSLSLREAEPRELREAVTNEA